MSRESKTQVRIIGGGLAGSEAAWQLASRGHRVVLYEMRPKRGTEAHQTAFLAELVCSNSFRAADLKNAVGLLKEEMRLLDSLIIQAADKNAIPGGGALVLDREGFSQSVTQALLSHPLIELRREEVVDLGAQILDPLLIATGPLTSQALSQEILQRTRKDTLYFYDSIAPIVEAESIDYGKVFKASRWGKGTADYWNCPLSKEEYYAFVQDLVMAEKVPTKEFEKPRYFESCLPIEVMAERGPDVLSFGPMKPVGLIDPRTGKRPFAVVQLRQDNLHGTLFNMVGFQTRMKYPEQLRTFRKIPGLEQATFARLGSMHRNTFINAPELLDDQLQLKEHPGIFMAGQMIGVEGYVESAAMGLYAGLALDKFLQGSYLMPPPPVSALGALIRHLTQASPKGFQPMNINFGLMDLPRELRKKDRRLDLAKLALDEIKKFKEANGPFPNSAGLNLAG